MLRRQAAAQRWSADELERDAVSTARRRGPAFASKIASLALSLAATLGLAVLFARADDQQSIEGSADDPDTGTEDGAVVTMPPSTAGTVVPGSTTTLPPGTVPVDGIAIVDGTYGGAAFKNRWGVVQVEITYQGGQIVDVGVLQYPASDRKSVSINQRALPLLEDAVLAAQSADISSVTGATITSRSYQQSLQSALDAAAAASAGAQG